MASDESIPVQNSGGRDPGRPFLVPQDLIQLVAGDPHLVRRFSDTGSAHRCRFCLADVQEQLITDRVSV